MSDGYDDNPTTVKRNQSQAGERVIPHNTHAEESLLGAALMSDVALEVAVTETETDDYHVPAHQLLHQTMRRLWESGVVRLDPVVVADELASQGLLDAVGGPVKLALLQAGTPSTTAASSYARIVTEQATLRRLLAAGMEITELAYASGGPGGVAEAVDMAQHIVGQVELPVGQGVPSPAVDQFLEGEDSYDWLVEGLLERRDRIIITGGEGGGKSTMLRQLAVCMAAGLHPFAFQPLPAVRVLVVDVENSPNQIRRAMAPMVERLSGSVSWNPDNLRLEARTEGLDLTQRHDSRWLMERVATNRPDVLITGPIYKLHAEDPNDELPARKVARVFDMLRAKYDCAIILEAHSPHGNGIGGRSLRPFGSSLWLRWPEFGYGLKPDREAGEIDGRPAAVYFEAWRGPRDQREWPARLSSDGAMEWPWRDSAKAVTVDVSGAAPRRPVVPPQPAPQAPRYVIPDDPDDLVGF